MLKKNFEQALKYSAQLQTNPRRCNFNRFCQMYLATLAIYYKAKPTIKSERSFSYNCNTEVGLSQQNRSKTKAKILRTPKALLNTFANFSILLYNAT